MLGLAVVTDANDDEVAWIPATDRDDASVPRLARALIGKGGRPIAAHGQTADAAGRSANPKPTSPRCLDTMIAAYLLDPAESAYGW